MYKSLIVLSAGIGMLVVFIAQQYTQSYCVFCDVSPNNPSES